MANGAQTEGRRRASPPYTAYQSLKTMAKQMQEHGVPNRVDRSVLTNFSGAVGGQLITALKFLGLTDAAGTPTEKLHSLVKSYETDEWTERVGEIVHHAYEPIFDLDLESASPSQFNERFRGVFEGTEDVSRKCITFFLNAAQDGGIKISPYILKNKKPRSAPAKRRAVNGEKNRAAIPKTRNRKDPPETHSADKSPSEILLGLFEPNEMEDEEQQAVWTLLRYFKSRGE